MKIGSWIDEHKKTHFKVWAPYHKTLSLLMSDDPSPLPMQNLNDGYHEIILPRDCKGLEYWYQTAQGRKLSDPASHYQKQGVHGPSCVVDHSFDWQDQLWQTPPLQDLIIYELHTGSFDSKADFTGISQHLDHLVSTGINAIEIMPVNQFPGKRNWGYDGVYPFAVQDSYGGPDALKTLVDQCHRKGLAVILDVVYNHLGPEGNYFPVFGPYFTEKYHTPWGPAINYDDKDAAGVRNYVLENILYWFRDYHIDGLRLDAIHAIYDHSEYHILAQVRDSMDEYNRENQGQHFLIAESELNDPRLIVERTSGGHGMDAQWLDDWHHIVHTLITGENGSYYQYYGQPDQMADCLNGNYILERKESPALDKALSVKIQDLAGDRFVICTQNHDQIGNRPFGRRLEHIAGYDAAKLAALLLFSSPFIPLIYMGEEWACSSPFLYFVDHSDKGLIQAVREGRAREFAGLMGDNTPPDPQSAATWKLSLLDWDELKGEKHKIIHELYRFLISWRYSYPQSEWMSPGGRSASMEGRTLHFKNKVNSSILYTIANLSPHPVEISWKEKEGYQLILDTSHKKWLGQGSSAPQKPRSGDMITVAGFGGLIYSTEPGDLS